MFAHRQKDGRNRFTESHQRFLQLFGGDFVTTAMLSYQRLHAPAQGSKHPKQLRKLRGLDARAAHRPCRWFRKRARPHI